MKFDEITPTLSESRQGNLLLDIEHWHNSAKSIDEIVSLASEKYKLDVPRDYVERAIMMAGDESSEALNEVKMSTNIFDQFINSPEAEGIAAGFEAELIFTGIAPGADSLYADEPEMDESEDRRPRSIEDICDFFHDGDHNSRRDVEHLREKLEEEFHEWHNEQMDEAWGEAALEAVKEYIENNDWDEEDEMRQYMDEEMGLTDEAIDEAMEWYGAKSRGITSSKQQNELKRTDQSYTNFIEAADAIDERLMERVQDSIDSQDHNYEGAREEWEEDVREDYDDSQWLRESEYDYMTDVYRENDINWPYWSYSEPESEGGYSVSAAQQLADGMERSLDVNITVADGYHSTKRRPGLWIFEPDSSLSPDDDEDMPVEIISPPMPLKQTLEILPKFYDWAKSEDAYSNDSTGFHIGVSLPIQGGRVDYVKLALFLGDQYVLDEFERGSNYFTKSSMSKLRQEVEKGTIDAAKVADTLKLMKHNLIEFADKTIKRGGGAHGKYSSINMKGDYIEFRSMGSESYFSKPDSLAKVLDTIKRYAYAMHIASRPDLFRDEYAKKLYKLLDKEGNDSEAMKQFADYVTAVGGVDPKTVKDFFYNIKSDKYSDAPLPDRQTPARSGMKSGKYWWNVKYNGQRMEVVASNKAEAKAVAVREWGLEPRQTLAITSADITMLRPFKDSPGGVGNWVIVSGGKQVFRITASTQGDANQKAREWLAGRSPEYRQEHAGEEVEVLPVEQWKTIQKLLTP